MTIPDICPGHGEANAPRPEFGGRTPAHQALNEGIMEIIVDCLVALIAVSSAAYLVGAVFGWWAA